AAPGARGCRVRAHAETTLRPRVLARWPRDADARCLAGSGDPVDGRQYRPARVGSGILSPLVSLAVGGPARAPAAIAHGAVSRRHPHGARAPRRAGCTRGRRRTAAGAGGARHLLAAVGHGGGGRHLVRTGLATPAAHAGDRPAAGRLAARAAAAAHRPRRVI